MPATRLTKQLIEKRIFIIRGYKVMFDEDLAKLYDVSTKRLNEQVTRNERRFPKDFMFRLKKSEFEILRSQFATSRFWGGRRYLPRVFTEQGIAMLSTVLNSEKAIRVNIAIMRAFVKIREYAIAHKEFAVRLKELERKVGSHDKQVQNIFTAIRCLIKDQSKPRPEIGFHTK